MKQFLLVILLCISACATAQTRQDTLRGSNGRGRDWWDVLRYDLRLNIDTARKTISGTNRITFRVVANPSDSMQIDLQNEMRLEFPLDGYDRRYAAAFGLNDQRPPFPRDGNIYWSVQPASVWQIGGVYTMTLVFSGQPTIAQTPPWDGGLVWKQDVGKKTWAAVACQGKGASLWFPCKDYQGDEPDSGITISPDFRSASFISNGVQKSHLPDTIDSEDLMTGKITRIIFPTSTYNLYNPVNLYNITFYLGDYATFTDTFHSEAGTLPLTFHPLSYNLEKAKKHWAVTKDMLRCFEHWMGPYPFIEDGYKLVEAPYLGMEHQSAIAYGNKYQMGYLGKDRSGTGVGLLFDYIIIHESGHEWFGNNITAADPADNWIHEGFTTYTETLYAEWIAGKEAGARYCRGEWRNIENDKPVIGRYGIAEEGSGDRYDKGAALIHTIRTVLGNDSLFRQMLRRLNKTFWHQTVTTKQIEDYIDGYTSLDLRPVFDQYLRTTNIPVLEWRIGGGSLHYRFTNCTKGFQLFVPAAGSQPLLVDDTWRSTPWAGGKPEWTKDILMKVRRVKK